jgi:hypothetical protein
MIVLLMSLACTDGGPGDDVCVDNSACDEGHACVAEECVTGEWLDSAACGRGQFCDPRNYVCRDGCETDGDCLAGQECNTQTLECVDSACRSAELDCQVGQKCDEVTGQCFDFPGSLCDKSCDIGAQNDTCGNGSSCEFFIDGSTCNTDAQCDGAAKCDQFIVQETCNNDDDCPTGATRHWLWGYGPQGYCHEDSCRPVGNPNVVDSCPAGFQCLSDGQGGNSCYGECGYYKENGYL